MSLPSIQSFAHVFSSVLENRHEDPLLRVLVLTYEFDERQILNLACAQSLEQEFELRQSLMRTLCELRPVVLYDARKTRECAALPQFLELHPVHAGPWACHHSKAYLQVTRDTIRLVLGSFNLTATGLFKNREVFEVLRWDKDNREDQGLLREWIEFLETHVLVGMDGSSKSALTEIVAILNQRLEAPAVGTPRTKQLLHSGYEATGTGLDQLVKAWANFFPGTQPEHVFVVSPFFDLSPRQGSFAADLHRAFPTLHSMELITSETGKNGLGKDHFADFLECRLQISPELIDEAERTRLEKQQGLGNDVLVKRGLHAKLLCLVSGRSALMYGGSANFTRKAWGTVMQRNRELGLVQVCEDFGPWRKAALECLSVPQMDVYPLLPAFAPEALPSDDAEGYADSAGYPEFLGWVQLCTQQDETLRFAFHAAEEMTSSIDSALATYRIEWRGLVLGVRKGLSQPVTLEQLRERLVGGRNLRLIHQGHPDSVHWFPFQYDALLVEERTDFVHPTVWDWFDFHLDPSRQEEMGFAEFLPGQDDGSDDGTWNEVNREANSVIRMQTYLSRFEKTEAHFLKQLDAMEECRPEDRGEVFHATVSQPLRGLLHLLVRDAKGSDQSRIESLFRVGELALFLGRMNAKAEAERSALNELLQESLTFMKDVDKAAQGLERYYGRFVRQEAVKP
jgi:hypothetical protein